MEQQIYVLRALLLVTFLTGLTKEEAAPNSLESKLLGHLEKSGAPDLCLDSSIDAATVTADGQAYFFKGNYYWKIEETGISEGYPRNIISDWPGLPGNLDAAMTWTNGKTYFFKKNLCWKFHNKDMESGYPKNISVDFPSIPNDVDVAFVWGENNKAYFFKGDSYWSIDPNSEPPETPYYPQPISKWIGIPNNIDAAILWTNRVTYFFKGSDYYRYNDKTSSVEEADPPYPRSTSVEWFRCETSVPDLCEDSLINAATTTQDGQTYVFKGKYYWKIEETGISDPRKTSLDWLGLPGNLDAAMTYTDGKTYFFKQNLYWRFHNKDMDKGYPKYISYDFPGISSDVDAAFIWGQDNKPYFFKGDNYWSIAPNSEPPETPYYPQPISKWIGIPNNIDAAIQWTNRVTYFFKGSNYYRFNDKTSSVKKADPPYPRSTSMWWFECESSVPDLCEDSLINAATTTQDGQTYVFKGNYYWKIEETGLSDGYPRKIFLDWLGLPGNLDAAMTLKNGKTYFFKKNLCWRFHNKEMESGYPKSISDDFPGIPSDLNAAFVWSLNDKIYFFKGENFWMYDNETKPSVSSRYPQPISHWQGVPDNIDAALQWHRNTYFIKGSKYYQFNDTTLSVTTPHPRSTYFWWFDCENVRSRAVEN